LTFVLRAAALSFDSSYLSLFFGAEKAITNRGLSQMKNGKWKLETRKPSQFSHALFLPAPISPHSSQPALSRLRGVCKNAFEAAWNF
jgi:hypothetical protein